jgi:hypothetical protein
MAFVIRAILDDGTSQDRREPRQDMLDGFVAALQQQANVVRVEVYTEGIAEPDSVWSRDEDSARELRGDAPLITDTVSPNPTVQPGSLASRGDDRPNVKAIPVSTSTQLPADADPLPPTVTGEPTNETPAPPYAGVSYASDTLDTDPTDDGSEALDTTNERP